MRRSHSHTVLTHCALISKPAEEEEEELPDLADKDVQDATLKIQAGFRGMMARKAMKTDAAPEESAGNGGNGAMMEVPTAKEEEEDEEMPDLNDADVQAATLKIQAGFKVGIGCLFRLLQ